MNVPLTTQAEVRCASVECHFCDSVIRITSRNVSIVLRYRHCRGPGGKSRVVEADIVDTEFNNIRK